MLQQHSCKLGWQSCWSHKPAPPLQLVDSCTCCAASLQSAGRSICLQPCNTRFGQYGGVPVAARVVILVTPVSSQNSVTHLQALLSCVTQKSCCFEAVWCCRCIGTCCPLGMQSAGPTTPFAYGICLQHKMWPLWQCGCCRQGCQSLRSCYLNVVTEIQLHILQASCWTQKPCCWCCRCIGLAAPQPC